MASASEYARYSRNLFEVNLDAMLTVDPDGIIRDANPSLAELPGYPMETMLGESIFDPQRDREGFKLALEQGYLRDYPARMLHASGCLAPVMFNDTVYRDDTGEVAGVLVSARDVAERNHLIADLEHQALHDSLTRLPNRALLTDRLEHALERAGRGGGRVAVWFMDLERFKVVNDSLGHGAGDRLLVEAAERLSRCMRYGDTVARIGGDEFVVLMEDITDDNEAVVLAERVVSVLRDRKFDVEGQEVVVSASVGITIGGAGDTSSELLRNADLAMYGAKRSGKDGHRTFSPEMDENARLRLRMESALREAVEHGEIEVHYQPKANFTGGGIHGFEALVRWESPERGLVSPIEFVPLAEETGLIVSIGKQVLGTACRQARRWLDDYPGLESLVMAVNVSAVQLRGAGIVNEVRAALRESGLPARNLCLEITESTLMADAEANMLTLMKLKALGVGLAIDDFGTGSSSFS